MPVIGSDCHITLTHPDVNGGIPSGFVLYPEGDRQEPAVILQREITSDGKLTVRVFFDILLADYLLNPDGSVQTLSRAAMYALLIACLEQTSGLTLAFSGGTIANIGALGHSATERHTADFTIVACQFNNAGTYYGMMDTAGYENSTWDGTLTWASSYWR